jgi:prevent-host-death family protein
MDVKTGELKNRLSHYLRLVEHGETITVLVRNRPVAKLVPAIKKPAASSWKIERERLIREAANLNITLHLPETEPKPFHSIKVSPRVAPDGRTDISTMEMIRNEREY